MATITRKGDRTALTESNLYQYDDAISRREILPIILLGAPRSGTQMYRDMICDHPEVVTWPYNEMTYMWRYGNRDYPSDEIPVEKLTPHIAAYIRNSFIRLGNKSACRLVLDKTCHNCLRPEFVAAVLPEARFIYLVRHGIDVVPSTVMRSQSSPPYGEYKRILSIPPGDVAYYMMRAAWNHGSTFLPGKRAVKAWGPRFRGMKELAKTKSVHEVAAHQWVRHMELVDQFVKCQQFDMPLLKVRYEEITSKPEFELKRVFGFLNIDTPNDIVEKWKNGVRHRIAGSRGSLLGEYEQRIREIISEKNAEHGYG